MKARFLRFSAYAVLFGLWREKNIRNQSLFCCAVDVPRLSGYTARAFVLLLKRRLLF